MRTQRRFWWKKNKRLLITVTAAMIVLIVVFALAVYWFGWEWTGFNGGYSQITTTSTSHGTTKATVKPPGKTLWDLLQLLIIPVVLAIGGFWLNQIQKSREEKVTEQQAELERELTRDNQRETSLQAYIDKMSELLLLRNLRDSTEGEEVRKIARVRTLTVLQRLDAERKGSVLQFLQESGLIGTNKRIIDLSGADLSAANLSSADLRSADLRDANLSDANLSGADLHSADLRPPILVHTSEADPSAANLSSADTAASMLAAMIARKGSIPRATQFAGRTLLIKSDLSGANLSKAILRGVILSRANLSDANLSETDLSETDLSNANLSDAKVTQEQLDKAKSLMGAIMPDGSRHP